MNPIIKLSDLIETSNKDIVFDLGLILHIDVDDVDSATKFTINFIKGQPKSFTVSKSKSNVLYSALVEKLTEYKKYHSKWVMSQAFLVEIRNNIDSSLKSIEESYTKSVDTLAIRQQNSASKMENLIETLSDKVKNEVKAQLENHISIHSKTLNEPINIAKGKVEAIINMIDSGLQLDD